MGKRKPLAEKSPNLPRGRRGSGKRKQKKCPCPEEARISAIVTASDLESLPGAETPPSVVATPESSLASIKVRVTSTQDIADVVDADLTNAALAAWIASKQFHFRCHRGGGSPTSTTKKVSFGPSPQWLVRCFQAAKTTPPSNPLMHRGAKRVVRKSPGDLL